MSIVGGTMASGCSVCETKQRTSVVVCVMEVRGVREMMVWCGWLKRQECQCVAIHIIPQNAHIKCRCGLLCGGESVIGGEWRGKEQEGEQKRRKKEWGKDKHKSIFQLSHKKKTTTHFG